MRTATNIHRKYLIFGFKRFFNAIRIMPINTISTDTSAVISNKFRNLIYYPLCKLSNFCSASVMLILYLTPLLVTFLLPCYHTFIIMSTFNVQTKFHQKTEVICFINLCFVIIIQLFLLLINCIFFDGTYFGFNCHL
jgi:hypothetical protein